MNSTMTMDTRNQDSPGVNIMPPAVFYSCLAVGGLLEFFFPTELPLFPAWLRIVLGIGIGAAGFWFMILAHEKFKAVGTNVPTNLPATTLVIQGAYRLSRNPMYVGGSAFFLGIALVVGSLWMVLTYLPLGVYLTFYVVPTEEAYMQRVYGSDYTAYCRKVRRWL